ETARRADGSALPQSLAHSRRPYPLITTESRMPDLLRLTTNGVPLRTRPVGSIVSEVDDEVATTPFVWNRRVWLMYSGPVGVAMVTKAFPFATVSVAGRRAVTAATRARRNKLPKPTRAAVTSRRLHARLIRGAAIRTTMPMIAITVETSISENPPRP